MTLLRCLAPIFALTMGFAPCSSAQNTLSETDKKRILEKLDKLKGVARDNKFGRFSAAMSAYQAAAETPTKAYTFYLECVKLVEFDQNGKKFSEFRDWKADNIQEIRATEHATMLQFQLRYLALSIRALNMEDRSKVFPQLYSFIDSAVARREFMGPRNARKLRQPVSGTVFARAYGLDKAFGGGAAVEGGTGEQQGIGWELAPLNVMGHYQSTILPVLRDQGDAGKLESAWDRLIKTEIALRADAENPKVQEEFAHKTLPSMRWTKWMDVAATGERAKAANAMLALVEKNLKHDNVESWIDQLKEIVEGGSVSEEDFAISEDPPTAAP